MICLAHRRVDGSIRVNPPHSHIVSNDTIKQRRYLFPLMLAWSAGRVMVVHDQIKPLPNHALRYPLTWLLEDYYWIEIQDDLESAMRSYECN